MLVYRSRNELSRCVTYTLMFYTGQRNIIREEKRIKCVLLNFTEYLSSIDLVVTNFCLRVRNPLHTSPTRTWTVLI